MKPLVLRLLFSRSSIGRARSANSHLEGSSPVKAMSLDAKGSVGAATVFGCIVMICAPSAHAAVEDIEFVAEHLAEAAMDNRYASLPLWAQATENDSWSRDLQGAFSRTTVGGLALEGPMISAAVTRPFSARWSAGAFAFLDALNFTAKRDRRPMNPLFSTAIPLALPADALFEGLDGSARDIGFGIFLARHGEGGWLGERHWIGGVLWQKVVLRDYRLAYTLLSGPDAGASGSIDYSADYNHVTPIAGLEVIRRFGHWSLSPRVLAAIPLPRRGVQGCITGAGFDLCGNTADAGHGKHFGDPFLALGMGIGYDPWGLTLDIGNAVAQTLVEPLAHKGIDRDWILSLDWRF